MPGHLSPSLRTVRFRPLDARYASGVRDLASLPTPALVLDLDRLERNLDRMAARCERLGVALRPHVKTHKCVEIGRLQIERGARGVTVSTLEEARVFADAGFDDLTWAFPVILNRLEEVRALAERATLRLLVDSAEAVAALEALSPDSPLHVWLKVDCGYGRAGVDPAEPSSIDLARQLADSPSLTFDGILTHSGHAYAAADRSALLAVAEQERRVLADFAERLRAQGVTTPGLSVGSTPAMSVVEDLTGVTEARPGNYALYDFMQVALGACTPADCAATVLASVVSTSRAHSVVDSGALALSKEPGPGDRDTQGEVFEDYASGALSRDIRLTGLSQEHGKVSCPLGVGERLRVLPVHSCLAVACFDRFHVVRGDEVLDEWPIHRAR